MPLFALYSVHRPGPAIRPARTFTRGPAARLWGTVEAPGGSRIVSGVLDDLLAVPTASGPVRLSAGDAWEQAGVGGCELLRVGSDAPLEL